MSQEAMGSDPASPDEDLVLADVIPAEEADDAECSIDSCGEAPLVSLGAEGEMEYCKVHAIELARQLLQISEIREEILAELYREEKG